MHILLSVQTPDAPRIAVAAQLSPGNRHLAVARHCALESFLLNPSTPPYLTAPTKLVFPAKIDALDVVRDSKLDTLAVLSGETLCFVQLDSLGLRVVHRVQIGRGTEPAKMIVIAVESGECYVAIHHRQGFITMVDAGKLLEADTARGNRKSRRGRSGRSGRSDDGPRQKRARNSPSSRTYAIGHVSVVSLTALSGKTPSLAILYRDVLFSYSLRYYSFLGLDKPLEVSHQLAYFQEAPLLVFSVHGGVVVMSDLRCFYFPSPHLRAVVRAKDDTHVTSSSSGDVVTLDLLAHDAVEARGPPGALKKHSVSFLGALFLSHAQISPTEHIIVSDMGHTVQITLELSTSVELAVVSRFSAADLGLSTVASSVVQISDDVLFAASRLSRSVLFRVRPHLSVLAFLPSSPPILDFAASDIDDDEGVKGNDLIMALGGFHCGELVVRSLRKYHASFVRSGITYPDATGLQVESIADEVKFFVTGSHWIQRVTINFESTRLNDLFTYGVKQPLERDRDIQMEIFRENDIAFVKYETPGGEASSVSKKFPLGNVYLDGSTLVFRRKFTHKIDLPDLSQPTCLDVLEDEDGAVHLIVLTWSGSIYWVTVDKEIKLYAKSQFPLEGNITAALYPSSGRNRIIVAVDGVGNLVQRSFYDNKALDSVETKATFGDGPYALVGMGVSKLGNLLLTSGKTIFSLSPTKEGSYLHFSEIFTTESHILACQNAGAGRVLVLERNGKISLITCEKLPMTTHNFSHRMFYKVLRRSDYIVAIQLDFRPNRSAGRMERISSLSLFTRKDLKCKHEYKQELTSICWLGRNEVDLSNAHIVSAGPSDDPNKIFTIFEISGDKLVPVAQPEILGRYPQPFSVSKISWIDGSLHCVGNAYVVLTLDYDKDRLVWRSDMKDSSLAFLSLTYGIDVCKVTGQTFVADSSRGILTYVKAEERVGSGKYKNIFKPIDLPFGPCFVTAIAGCGNLVIYGDSVGNVGAFSVENGGTTTRLKIEVYSYKQVFGCNVGDVVNTIYVRDKTVFIGTSGGGIFRIDDISVSHKLISECKHDLESWQAFDHVDKPATGILNGDLIKESTEGRRVQYQITT